MHAHDRTLLAQLGFKDKDKGDNRHDLACRYLSQPEIAKALGMRLYNLTASREWEDYIIEQYIQVERGQRRLKQPGVMYRNLRVEVPISKGADQYKTTIGFIDVAFDFLADFELRAIETRYKTTKEEPWITVRDDDAKGRSTQARICIEVKIARVSVGDLIRQIKLYREYVKDAQWIAATAYPLADDEIATLDREEIMHVLLGDKFNQWVSDRERQNATSGKSLNFEI